MFGVLVALILSFGFATVAFSEGGRESVRWEDKGSLSPTQVREVVRLWVGDGPSEYVGGFTPLTNLHDYQRFTGDKKVDPELFKKGFFVLFVDVQKPTAGYDIEVVSVEKVSLEGDKVTLKVRANQKGPPLNSMVAQVLTRPNRLIFVEISPSKLGNILMGGVTPALATLRKPTE
jgi:hypothetical protein